MPNFNFKVIGLVLAVALIIFFAGSYLVDNYRVNQSLPEDLTDITGVEEVEIDSESDYYKLEITLDQPDNLQQTFGQIKRIVEDSLGEEDYELKFKDSADLPQELTMEVELALYEAAETGEFVKLGDRLDMYQNKYDLDQKLIQFDEDYIYLMLVKEKQAAYQIIKR